MNGVSLEVTPKETLGLVGESGCGKSVTALAAMGLIPIPPGRIDGGKVLYRGRDILRMSPAELRAQVAATVTEFAAGLNDPRGLAFGPDGHLYVAEAGVGGGTMSTVGQCRQVDPPVGPFVAGYFARVVRLSPSGEVAVVADGLPSSEATALVGGDRQGASAVAFIGNRLLALIAGACCSHGHAADDNGIFDVGARARQLPRSPGRRPARASLSIVCWCRSCEVARRPLSRPATGSESHRSSFRAGSTAS